MHKGVTSNYYVISFTHFSEFILENIESIMLSIVKRMV